MQAEQLFPNCWQWPRVFSISFPKSDMDPETVTNRLSLSASDNNLVRRRPHASRARNHVAWIALRHQWPSGSETKISSALAVAVGKSSLGSTQVILAMLSSVAVSASLCSVFTYITPILENVTLISPHEVTFMLLLFGTGRNGWAISLEGGSATGG